MSCGMVNVPTSPTQPPPPKAIHIQSPRKDSQHKIRGRNGKGQKREGIKVRSEAANQWALGEPLVMKNPSMNVQFKWLWILLALALPTNHALAVLVRPGIQWYFHFYNPHFFTVFLLTFWFFSSKFIHRGTTFHSISYSSIVLPMGCNLLTVLGCKFFTLYALRDRVLVLLFRLSHIPCHK